MPKLSELMKNVSLHTLDKIEELDDDERLIVFYEDDAGEFDSNRNTDIAATPLQLDAVLCYTDRKDYK